MEILPPEFSGGPTLPPDKENKWLQFLEQPLVTLPVGTLAGLAGVFFYSPVLVLCGICLILGFHRSKVVAGKDKLRVQLPAYVILTLVLLAGLGGLHIVIQRKLKENDFSLTKIIRTAMQPESKHLAPSLSSLKAPPAPPIKSTKQQQALKFEFAPFVLLHRDHYKVSDQEFYGVKYGFAGILRVENL
jgi:hypothetical protein